MVLEARNIDSGYKWKYYKLKPAIKKIIRSNTTYLMSDTYFALAIYQLLLKQSTMAQY